MTLKTYTVDGKTYLFVRQVENVGLCGSCAFKKISPPEDGHSCPGGHSTREALYPGFPAWCNGSAPEHEYLLDTPENRAEALARCMQFGSRDPNDEGS